MSSRSVNLLALFLDRLSPPKPLTSNRYYEHIFLPVTDDCPTWIGSRESMAAGIISLPIPRKVMWPDLDSNLQPWIEFQTYVISTIISWAGSILIYQSHLSTNSNDECNTADTEIFWWNCIFGPTLKHSTHLICTPEYKWLNISFSSNTPWPLS